MSGHTTEDITVCNVPSPSNVRPIIHTQQYLDSEIIQIGPRSNSNDVENDNESEFDRVYSGGSQLPKWKAISLFILFTLIFTIAGIIIVCVTGSRKPIKPCEIRFVRTRQTEATFDSKPRHAAVADFNQDGERDIVIVNTAFDTINIRFGYGNTTFSDQTSYSTGAGSQPYWVAVEDFNNDRFLDIVVASYGSNSIDIFLGDGRGIFLRYTTLSLGSSRPLALDIGHFNNDTHYDIAVITNGTFYVMLLYGYGDGSFEIGKSYYMGFDSMPCSIAVADLNRDTRSDIVVVNYGTSELVLFLSNDNDTFTLKSYSTGIKAHPTSVAVEHLNNDNYLDIALTNSGTHNIGIFLGDGNGYFAMMKTYSAPSDSYLQFIFAHQVRNDGNCDLTVVDSRRNYLYIFYGNGNGSFTLSTSQSTGFGSTPFSIVVDDFNNNNQSDVLVIANENNDIQLLTSYTLYTIANQSSYSTDYFSYPKFVHVADVNNDGHLDVLVANVDAGNIGVFIGLGDGSFRDQETIPIAGYFRSYITADFNKDKKLDIAVLIPSSDQIDIFFGQGNGSFDLVESYSLEYDSYPFSLAIADFNNDGNPDLVTANRYANSLAVMFGNIDGTFLNAIYYNFTLNDSSPIVIAVGDFNKDGFSDVVSIFADSSTMAILLGTATDTFQMSMSYSLDNYYATRLALEDLNNDAKQDIVLISSYTNFVRVFLGQGDGTFFDSYTYVIDGGSYISDVVLGDFDQNKVLDIAVVEPFDSRVTLFLRDLNDSLTRQNVIFIEQNYSPMYITVGDLNHDSEIDIIVANSYSYTITILLLKYQAIYTKQTTYDQGSGKHPYSIIMADFDNDNRMDIAIANSGRDNVEILTEFSYGTFKNKIIRSTGEHSYPRCIVAADFDRDNRLDVAVVNYVQDSLTIILNPLDDTLTRSFVYSTGAGSYPMGIVTGDLNKDGWTDVIVSNSKTDNIDVFLGFNYPTFSIDHIIDYPSGTFPNFIAVADFNHDSLQDLAILCDNTHTIEIQLRNSDGSYRTQSSNTVCEYYDVKTFVIGDFNNDIHLDLAVACSHSASVSILFGAGDGTFPTSMNQSTGYYWPEFITAADFNKDGNLDIVVANRLDENIGVFLGYGNGSLSEQVLYSMYEDSRPVWIAVGDLNDDGILDLAIASSASDNIGMYFGSDDGTFHNFTIYSTGTDSAPISVMIGDFDKDNHTDFAVLNAGTKTVGIFYDYGNGTFSSPITYATKFNTYLKSMIVEDVNNDTILDIVVTDVADGNSNIYVFYGLTERKYLVPKVYSTTYRAEVSLMAIKDLNKNGRMDLLFTMSKIDKVGFMTATGNEPFGPLVAFSTGIGSGPSAVAVSDFNDDDRLDVAVVNSKASYVLILSGDGNGNLIHAGEYSTGINSLPNSIVIADVDSDDSVDILVTNSKTDEIGIFFGYSNGSFAAVRSYTTGYGSEPFSIDTADLDRDGLMDIVVAIAGISTVDIYYGTGNRTFTRWESYSFEYDYRTSSLAIGDVNNDTYLDIGVSNYKPGIIDVLLHTCNAGHSVVHS